ncbi:sigma-70 family RNA polymerase sigma factor [Phycisphaerales bacterium AB-hyl4]|uniref:Sigma-70 family RNA polymerase sigma factor n=1 Tax=Natronomicrosphaera hydrolytica TaxID=3242702 RepID=A0ABV4U3W3_9BACT
MTTETLWQQFRGELDAFLRRQVNNPADAEDLRQQVYLQMHRHLQQGEPPEHLRGWVYRIARNAIVDHRRRRAARPEARAADLTEVEPKANEPEANPETVQSLARCLLQIVEQLEEPYRSALRWSELEGLTQQAAAERAGVSLSGMKSRVQRGRTKLREALLACCEIELDGRNQPIDHRCRQPECACSST